MKVYEFGDATKPVIVLLPGTCCHWKNTFGGVLDGLQERFFVSCISYDGFDETEDTVFPTITEEVERIEAYILRRFGGNVCAVYGCSLGGSLVGLMAARGQIHMAYGILGSSDLDQAPPLAARIQTALVVKLIKPLLQNGRFKSSFIQRFFEKRMNDRGVYGQALMGMFGFGGGTRMDFVREQSIRNQFYSDLVTPLPENTEARNTEIHVLYALKMGEKYRARYEKHFAKPIIHEIDLQHEELLVCEPQQWVETLEAICHVTEPGGTV